MGGHFANRRWDKALLVFSLAVLWTIGIYPAYFYLVSNMGGDATGEGLEQTLSAVYRYYVIGLGVLWVASLVLSGWDARKGKQPFIQRWTASGVLGALLMVLTMGGLGAYQVMAYNAQQSMKVSNVEYSESKSLSSHEYSSFIFLHHINFGGFDYKLDNPERPPVGDGLLRVSFSHQNHPAAGVGFKLKLNGKYETDSQTTNQEGYADFSLPPGVWTINSLETEAWEKSSTDAGMVLVTGHEAVYAGGDYRTHPWYNSEGVNVKVGKEGDAGTFHVDIKPQIELVWPVQNDKADQAAIDSKHIRWRPSEGVEQYLVKLTRLERDGNTTTFHPVTSRTVTDATQLALNGIHHVSSEGDAEEYKVEIFGFDTNGRFVNSTEGSYRTASFILSDNNVFVEDKAVAHITDALTPENYERYRKDRKRLDAVELLIDEELLEAAEKLLASVDPHSRPILQKALQGYLLAKRGDCAGAEQYFSEAELDEECRCKVKRFRKVCTAQ